MKTIGTFEDGTTIDFEAISWRANSEEVTIENNGARKTIYLSNLPLKSLYLSINDISTELKIPDGSRVYQSTKCQTVSSGDKVYNRVLSRTIGFVVNGSIVEEVILDAQSGIIRGYKT
jgi:hypothetical protein